MINYSNSNTGELCHAGEIISSLCNNGSCIEEFDTSSSSCRPSSDINVTVFMITNLGKGPPTSPIMEG